MVVQDSPTGMDAVFFQKANGIILAMDFPTKTNKVIIKIFNKILNATFRLAPSKTYVKALNLIGFYINKMKYNLKLRPHYGKIAFPLTNRRVATALELFNRKGHALLRGYNDALIKVGIRQAFVERLKNTDLLFTELLLSGFTPHSAT